MQIDNWKTNTGTSKRLGTFDLTLPSGMVLKQCSLVNGDNGHFIGLPQSAWVTASGEKKYTSVVEIPDREIRQKFTDAVLVALGAEGYL